MKRAALLIATLGFAVWAFGQEHLAPLGSNAQLKPDKTVKPRANKNAKALDESNLIYVVDTITDLPFIDDFTRPSIKVFNADPNDPQYDRVFRYKFTIDGVPWPTITYTEDPQWEYVGSPNGIDSVLMPPTQVVLYEETFPYLPDTTINVWLRGNDTLHNPNTTTLINISDTLVVVPDDNTTLWTGAVFINDNYAIGAPTYGVATFDGLDSVGLAYDFSSSSTYGEADMLTSKPLGMGTRSEADSVYLSFYFQPQGHGNKPEENDSLILEFWDPAVGSAGSWIRQWAVTGRGLAEFEYVLVPIREERYFFNGFKFRFRNYATLAGNLDHWHIDYVHLGTNRNNDDRYSTDTGWRYRPKSYINTWTVMPYDHYKLDPGTHTVQLYEAVVHNLEDPTDLGANLVPMSFEVLETDGTSIHGPIAPTTPNPTQIQPGDSTFFFQLNNGGDPFTFPDDEELRASWLIKTYYDSQNDEHLPNDTIVQEQVFDTYYAYDDGSAEKGYGLIGVGARMAQKFTLPTGISDTLRAVHIYFPQMLDNVVENDFQVVVWTGENGPGAELYRGFIVNPVYTEYGSFQRYEIFGDLIVSGTFYVGIEQKDADRIYVGFDENIDNSDNIWFNIGSGWGTTTFDGSLMIRPDFGFEPVIAGVRRPIEAPSPRVHVWPNPAKDRINVQLNEATNDLQLTLTDLSGRILWQGRGSDTAVVPLPENLPTGLYLLQAASIQRGVLETHRIMVID